jgi:Gpi18-like mannosyltransferase
MIALLRKTPIWFWRDILLPFAITRLVLTLVACAAFHISPLPSAFPSSSEIGRAGNIQPASNSVPATHPFINMWSRWDAGWYLEIAKHGYHFEAGKPGSAAFFPLYPSVIRLLHSLFFLPLTDYSYFATGILVSNICFIAGLTCLYALLSLDYKNELARWAVLAVLLFPTTFFYSAPYSESWLFFISIISF